MNMLTPVALPPGRLRLATRPSFTGSSPVLKTIGMVEVAAFCSESRGLPAGGNDHRHADIYETGRQSGQAIVMTLGPAKRDVYIVALDVTRFFQAFSKRGLDQCGLVGRPEAEKSDHGHHRLLRARRRRPCRHAAEQRDELAPLHV
jgi:hypothetical protein